MERSQHLEVLNSLRVNFENKRSGFSKQILGIIFLFPILIYFFHEFEYLPVVLVGIGFLFFRHKLNTKKPKKNSRNVFPDHEFLNFEEMLFENVSQEVAPYFHYRAYCPDLQKDIDELNLFEQKIDIVSASKSVSGKHSSGKHFCASYLKIGYYFYPDRGPGKNPKDYNKRHTNYLFEGYFSIFESPITVSQNVTITSKNIKDIGSYFPNLDRNIYQDFMKLLGLSDWRIILSNENIVFMLPNNRSHYSLGDNPEVWGKEISHFQKQLKIVKAALDLFCGQEDS